MLELRSNKVVAYPADIELNDEERDLDMLEKLESILPEKLSIKLVPTSVMCGECIVTPEERLCQLEIEDRNVSPELLEYVRHLPDEKEEEERPVSCNKDLPQQCWTIRGKDVS